MTVKQTKDNETKEYVYSYSIDIFEKYIKEYLKKHINSWSKGYTFDGINKAFNEFLDNTDN